MTLVDRVPSAPVLASSVVATTSCPLRVGSPLVLAKAHRLTAGALFTQASRRGRRAGSRTLVTHVVEGEDDGPRVGFVVSKAVGNAVIRNRVKRRLRHLVRKELASMPSSTVLVVRALPPAAEASSAELGEDLDRCLGRVMR